jgi:hypothetical protein
VGRADGPPAPRAAADREPPPASSYRARATARPVEPPAFVDEPPAPRARPTYRDEPTTYRTAPGSYRSDDTEVRTGQAAYRTGVADYRRDGEERSKPGSAYPGAPRRRGAAVPDQRRASGYDVDEDEEFDDEPVPGGYVAAMLYTVLWFAVPMVLWVLWSLTLSGEASANCVDDTGVPCASERTEALTTLTDNLPRMLGTMVFSILIAAVLRWVSSSWKAATVGFAAAVVGGGLATVGISAITGQPIG